jgi:hypothetical protein
MFRKEVEMAKEVVTQEVEKVAMKDYDDIQEYLQDRYRAVKSAVVKLGYNQEHPEYRFWVECFHG